jgi:cytochrome c oxidase assembly factor CtaG
MFVAMGAPLTMVRELTSPGVRARLSRLLHHRLARRLTYPLVITPIFVGPLPLIYLTPIYQASLEHTWIGALVALWLLGAGWMYFWTRFRIDPTPRTDTYLVSLGISAAEVGARRGARSGGMARSADRRPLLPRPGPAVGAERPPRPDRRRGNSVDRR